MDTISATVRRGLPEELLFADDLAIVASSEDALQVRLGEWQRALEGKGLKVNSGKTEVLVSSRQEGKTVNITDVHGTEVKQVKKFCYLGSTIEESGGCKEEVKTRISKAWGKWRDSSGIMCDKRMAVKLKAKFYKCVIRPVLLYGMETIALKREDERKLDATEMRMLRWITNTSLLEHRTNEDIRRFVKVPPKFP